MQLGEVCAGEKWEGEHIKEVQRWEGGSREDEELLLRNQRYRTKDGE